MDGQTRLDEEQERVERDERDGDEHDGREEDAAVEEGLAEEKDACPDERFEQLGESDPDALTAHAP